MKKFSKAIKALAATLAVAIAVTCFTPAPVLAAKTIATTKTWQKATAINKKGSTTVKFKKSANHYFKFVAPKNGTYTLVFDNMKSSSGGYACGHLDVYKVTANKYNGKLSLSNIKPKTEGGRSHTLYMDNRHTECKSTYSYLRKRSFKKIKLNKGDTLVFYLYITDMPSSIRVTVK